MESLFDMLTGCLEAEGLDIRRSRAYDSTLMNRDLIVLKDV